MRDSTVNFSVLHRTCKLVVLLCFFHISVTFIFYVRSLDFRFAFAKHDQTASKDTVTDAFETNHFSVDNVTTITKELGKCPDTSPLLGK